MASSNNTYIVLLLDGRQYSCKLNSKTLTEELFDCVISYLGIQEREYFGLCYISEPGKYREWIALEKRLVCILKYLTLNRLKLVENFAKKSYF